MKFLNASIASICSIALVIAPALTHAQPLESKSVEVDGRSGVWFPEEDADRLLDVVTRKLPEAESVIETQQEIIELQVQQIRTATVALVETSSVAKMHHDLAATAIKAFNEEADRNSGLFNEPAFWIVVGILIYAGADGLRRIVD